MVSNEKNSRVIHLSGKSRANNMYVRGPAVEYLSGNLSSESMILVDLDEAAAGLGDEKSAVVGGEQEQTKKTKADKTGGEKGGDKAKQEAVGMPVPILVTLYAMPSPKANGEYVQAERVMFIGCMKSTNEKKDVKRVCLNNL